MAEIGATPSIGSVGDSFDNALAETVNGYYKAELIRGSARAGRPWKTVEEVELATLGWVHWHNTQRLHGYLGDLPPVEFEALHAPEGKPNTPDPGDQSVTDTAARAAERLPAPQPEALELEITTDAASEDPEQRTRPPWPPTPPGAVAIICGNPGTGINRTPRRPKRTG